MVRTGTVSTKKAADTVASLSHAGYSRQTIDELVALIDKGIITDIRQVGGYPEYRGMPYQDSDNDGLPDGWETQHGLNPRDASDASGDLNGDGYTNVEDFINGLDPRAPKRDWSDPKQSVDARNVASL
jgi:hypothetical protein